MKKVEFIINDEVSYEELLQKLFEIKNIELQDFKVHKDDKLYHYFPFKHNKSETFYDEVKPMKKTITVSLFKDKNTNEYVADVTGEEWEGRREFQVYDASKYEKIESKEFEVEENNWNLKSSSCNIGFTGEEEEYFKTIDVKKCRDLILQDINDLTNDPKTLTIGFNEALNIISKRFGGL